MSITTTNSGPAFETIVDPLRPAFMELEKFLERQVEFFEPEVSPLVHYCFGHSGKKLRPLLLFASAGLGRAGARDPQVVKAAAIVELVHLATLVHDDILDEATVRHRTETISSRYGPHVAVLLGDALFSHALHLASEYPTVEVCRSVSRATRQVCSGEIAQTFARESEIPDLDAYFRVIDLKTAELFRVSVYLGGYLGGMSEPDLDALVAYATHLGRAYQIYDDMADIFGQEAQAGKTLGTDLATGKATLPVLLWLQQIPESQRPRSLSEVERQFMSRAVVDWQVKLSEEGIPDRTREVFLEETGAARRALHAVEGGSLSNPLEQLLSFLEAAWNKFSVQ